MRQKIENINYTNIMYFLPPIGIPWLGYELWKNHNKKNDDVWSKTSEKMGPLKSDFKSQDAYLSVVENEIRILKMLG